MEVKKIKNNEKLKGTRRSFIMSLSLGLLACGVNVRNVKSESEEKPDFKILGEEDQIDIGGRGKEMMRKAYDQGYFYEEKYQGCARCTVAALQDAIDFLPADEGLFRAASCLDGGATPTNLANCGAFTGSGMVIGWMCGTGRFGDNGLSHQLIHEVHQSFVDEHGSVICKEIREAADGQCPKVVANAAQKTTEILLKQFTNYV